MAEGTPKQFQIYFVSEALSGSKLLYSEMEKMAYVKVMVVRKLWHYLQSINIKVPASYPLQDMFENREASGRIGKWATQLAAYTIDFAQSKSQVLADFLADWKPIAHSHEPPAIKAIWQLECDGLITNLAWGLQQY